MKGLNDFFEWDFHGDDTALVRDLTLVIQGGRAECDRVVTGSLRRSGFGFDFRRIPK